MNIHWFQHVPFEGLGVIADWIAARGHSMSATRLFANETPPDVETFDWLVVMGGPMGACDEAKFPWMAAEKRCIEQAIARGKTVLGICLGAQMIASVLGARVYPNRQKEIGWFPLRVTSEGRATKLFGGFGETPPVFLCIGETFVSMAPDGLGEPVLAFHWHGDTFDLPAGAVRLAESEACENQAFVFREKVVGLQFHWEVTRAGVETLIANCRDELVEAPFIQRAEAMLSAERPFETIHRQMTTLLDRLGGDETLR